jgi:hypothetical protein
MPSLLFEDDGHLLVREAASGVRIDLGTGAVSRPAAMPYESDLRVSPTTSWVENYASCGRPDVSALLVDEASAATHALPLALLSPLVPCAGQKRALVPRADAGVTLVAVKPLRVLAFGSPFTLDAGGAHAMASPAQELGARVAVPTALGVLVAHAYVGGAIGGGIARPLLLRGSGLNNPATLGPCVVSPNGLRIACREGKDVIWGQ